MTQRGRQTRRSVTFPGKCDRFLAAGARRLVAAGVRLDMTEFPQGNDQPRGVAGLAADGDRLNEMGANLIDHLRVGLRTRGPRQGLAPQSPRLADERGSLAGRTHGV